MKSSSLKQSAKQSSLQVRAYLAALPADSRKHLEKLGEAIREAAPGAVESFGEGMPAFKLDRKPFEWYAPWKHQSSFYPHRRTTTRPLPSVLGCYELQAKETDAIRLH